MIETLLVAAGALGLGGIGGLWLTKRAQRAHIIDTRTAWMRTGQRVRFGPVGVISFGPLPQRLYRRGSFGALGLVNSALVIEGRRSHRGDLHLPLDRILRVDLSAVRMQIGRANVLRQALSVHHQGPDGWRVTTIMSDDLQEIATVLRREADMTVHDWGPVRSDYGPSQCTRMTQDLYGEWFTDRDGTLYLAPDRLLFDWRDDIALDTIQRLDVLTQGTWRDRLPGAEALLRVEAHTPDGIAISGFVVRNADRWASAIQRRIDEPIPVQSGRKKKDS